MFYHYVSPGSDTPFVFTHATQAVRMVIKDLATHMSVRELMLYDVSSKDRFRQAKTNVLDKPFVFGVVRGKVIWLMRSLNHKASIMEAIADPRLHHGGDWFLVDFLDDTIIRFKTLVDASIYVGQYPSYVSRLAMRKSPIGRGRFFLTRTLNEALVHQATTPNPIKSTWRHIKQVRVTHRTLGTEKIVSSSRALADLFPDYSAARMSHIINRATEDMTDSVCRLRIKALPQYDIEVTYHPQGV